MIAKSRKWPPPDVVVDDDVDDDDDDDDDAQQKVHPFLCRLTDGNTASSPPPPPVNLPISCNNILMVEILLEILIEILIEIPWEILKHLFNEMSLVCMYKKQKTNMCCFCRIPEFSSEYHSLAQKDIISSPYWNTMYLGTIVTVILNSVINLMRTKKRMKTRM